MNTGKTLFSLKGWVCSVWKPNFSSKFFLLSYSWQLIIAADARKSINKKSNLLNFGFKSSITWAKLKDASRCFLFFLTPKFYTTVYYATYWSETWQNICVFMTGSFSAHISSALKIPYCSFLWQNHIHVHKCPYSI